MDRRKKYGYDTIDGDCIIVLWYRTILFGNNEHKILQYLISALKGNCDLSSEHLATWNMGTLQRINGTAMNTDIHCWMAFFILIYIIRIEMLCCPSVLEFDGCNTSIYLLR